MNRRSLLASMLFAVLGLTSSFCHADALDGVMKNKVLRVAVPQDFPPFGSVGPDLKPVGYDIDMAKLIAHELGVEVELIPVGSANRIPYLTTNKADLVISSLGKNAERAKVVDFGDAYAPFFSAVFGLDHENVEKPADLVGKTVGVTRGAIEDLELSKMVPPTVTIKRFEDNNTTISAYLSGQVALIATGNVVAAKISEKQPNKRLDFKFMIKNSPCYVAANKGETRLLERVDAIIAKSKKDGSLDAIAKKWMKLTKPVASFL